MSSSSYNDQVFINCPFDSTYLDMYRACIFVVLDAGFVPRCSREVNNATESRLANIVNIIADCRYGIHDLSRVEVDVTSGLPRFNMPFELGIFYGAKQLGADFHKKKSCLILEKEPYRYHQFISDIAGIDVTPHENDARKLIIEIRQWLYTASRRRSIPSGEAINIRFKAFQTQIKEACVRETVDYDSMPFLELVNNMTDWLLLNQAQPLPLIRQQQSNSTP